VQNIFHQLDKFIKHSHSFAMTIFHKITKSAKLVILLIIPTYAKVSIKMKLYTLGLLALSSFNALGTECIIKASETTRPPVIAESKETGITHSAVDSFVLSFGITHCNFFPAKS
jgi:hypothetical protein